MIERYVDLPTYNGMPPRPAHGVFATPYPGGANIGLLIKYARHSFLPM
jgi:hypothetical protein